MLLLQDNKLVTVDTSEDSGVITCIKTKEQLNESSNYAVKSEIRQLIMHSERGYSDYGKYNWKVTQSSYSDDSSLNNYYRTFDTKGQAISKILEDGYELRIDGKLFTRDDLRI